MNSRLAHNSPLYTELNANQQALVSELKARSTIGLDELRERLAVVKELMALGYARLLVIQKPWGVEFFLQLAQDSD
jgi:hypothetical protein